MGVKKLFQCYLIFVGEIEEAEEIYLLAQEDDAGEFSNEKGALQRYFLCEVSTSGSS